MPSVPPAPPTSDAALAGATPVIQDDVACEGCGYVLRGLGADARCPECRTPVAESLHDDNLRQIPRRRLEQLRTGMRVAEVGLFGFLGGLLAQVTVTPLSIGLARSGLSSGTIGVAEAIVRGGGRLLIVLGLAAVVVAALLLSQLAPRDRGREDQRRLAATIRGGLLAGLLLVGIAAALPLIGVATGPGRPAGLFVQFGVIAGLFALGEAWRALLLRIAWLDDRSGDADGKADLRGLARGVRSMVIALCLIFGGRILLLATGGGPTWLPSALRGIGILVSFSLLPMLLGTVGGSVQLRRRIDLLLLARRELEALPDEASAAAPDADQRT